MAKQTFTAGQVLTATQLNNLQANDYNWTVNTSTTSYVLQASDAGTRRVMNAAGATTITVNTGIFTAGDTVWIHNISTGVCTITAGTATVNTAASLALAQWEGGALYFTSASSAIFFRGRGSNYGVATGGSSSTITVDGVTYTLLTFTGASTLTVTKAGWFDVLVVAGGGGGGGANVSTHFGGGGGGGGLFFYQEYFSANQTIAVGGGGAGGPNTGGAGSAGTNSSIGTFRTTGGGFGAGRAGTGGNGFSGGGGGNNAGAGGTGSPGYNGGTAPGGDNASGGGGGILTAGAAPTAGTGIVSTWNGTSRTYAAGGAGTSSASGAGANGAANTGNGGGGAGGVSAAGGNGGSGVVYVRFAQ